MTEGVQEIQKNTKKPRRNERLTRAVLSAILPFEILAGCRMVEQRVPQIEPIPIVEPTQSPEATVNGVRVTEFPHYIDEDEKLFIEPPALEEVDAELIDRSRRATVVVGNSVNRETEGIITYSPMTGVIIEGGTILTALHAAKDDNGNLIHSAPEDFIIIENGGIPIQIVETRFDPNSDVLQLKPERLPENSIELPISHSLPKPGSTVLVTTYQRFRETQSFEPDYYRAIFIDRDDGFIPTSKNEKINNSIRLRTGVDTTSSVNESAPGGSGGPMIDVSSGSVFAINGGFLGEKLSDGTNIREGIMVERAVVTDSSKIELELLGPYKASFGTLIPQWVSQSSS